MIVVAAGSNNRAQLGAGHRQDTADPVRSCLPEDLPGGHADVQLAAGAAHSLLLVQGSVFVCGANDQGQLGIGTTTDASEFVAAPIPHPPNDLIAHIACGWETSFAVSSSGVVWVAGCNAHGQAGTQTTGSVFVQLHGIPPIKRIACGLRHTLFLATDGSVWGCGSDRHGELAGLSLTKQNGSAPHIVSAPTKINSLPETIIAIACGQHHSLALDGSNGSILAFGRNRRGQLACGLPPSQTTQQPAPAIGIPPGESPVDVYAGWSHSIARCASGRIYTWGRNDHGQLGMPQQASAISNTQPSNSSSCWNPIELTSLHGATQIACGSEHTVAIVPQNASDASIATKVVSFGWNEHGNCAVGHNQDVITPTAIDLGGSATVLAVGAGGGHTLVAFLNF